MNGAGGGNGSGSSTLDRSQLKPLNLSGSITKIIFILKFIVNHYLMHFIFKLQIVDNCHTVTVYKSSGNSDSPSINEWRPNYYFPLGKPPFRGYKPPLLPNSSKVPNNIG